MSSRESIIKFFQGESSKGKKSKKNALNEWTIRRLLEEGKELTIFENGRKKGISLENPLTRLFVKGSINKQEYFAGKTYCQNYEISSISRHARPSYDGSSISSTAPNKDFYSQAQLDASKRVATAKGQLIANDITRSKTGKIMSRRYIEILEVIFERQMSFIAAEQKLKLDHRTIERKVREICQIILN